MNRITSTDVKPVKTIVIGVLLSFLITMISGMPLMMMFVDATSPDFESILASNNIYLLTSAIVSIASLIIASYIATKYAPRSELKFGIIIGFLIVAISIPMWVFGGTFSTYPIWYAVLSFLTPIPACYIGANLQGKKLNKSSNSDAVNSAGS